MKLQSKMGVEGVEDVCKVYCLVWFGLVWFFSSSASLRVVDLSYLIWLAVVFYGRSVVSKAAELAGWLALWGVAKAGFHRVWLGLSKQGLRSVPLWEGFRRVSFEGWNVVDGGLAGSKHRVLWR